MCGLGIKVATLTLIFLRRPAGLLICRRALTKSTRAFKSSAVSVGSPIIKYSLMTCHPRSKASLTVAIISASLIFLLITSRSRWLPASGAIVNPVLRTVLISFISSGVRVPALKDGRETATFSAA